MSFGETAELDGPPAEPPAGGSTERRADGPAGRPAVLVVGLGNPLLGDDGAGWRVVAEVDRRLAAHPEPQPVELDRLAVGGLGLMERLIGSGRAVIVDALDAGPDPPGTVVLLHVDDLPSSIGHLDGAHDASLAAALAAGRAMGVPLPTDIAIVAIRADPVDTFGEALSPEVEAAVPRAVEAVLRVVRDDRAEDDGTGAARGARSEAPGVGPGRVEGAPA